MFQSLYKRVLWIFSFPVTEISPLVYATPRTRGREAAEPRGVWGAKPPMHGCMVRCCQACVGVGIGAFVAMLRWQLYVFWWVLLDARAPHPGPLGRVPEAPTDTGVRPTTSIFSLSVCTYARKKIWPRCSYPYLPAEKSEKIHQRRLGESKNKKILFTPMG